MTNRTVSAFVGVEGLPDLDLVYVIVAAEGEWQPLQTPRACAIPSRHRKPSTQFSCAQSKCAQAGHRYTLDPEHATHTSPIEEVLSRAPRSPLVQRG